jgi:hypothetical protein
MRGQFRLELRPQLGVGARELELFEHRPYVQAGTPDQQRHPAPPRHGVDRGPGHPLVLGHARGLGHVPEVERVVRHALALFGAQLGGPDVHAAVELHRVGVDDLAAEAVGQGEAERGLPGRRRAHNGHHEGPLDRPGGSHMSLLKHVGAFPAPMKVTVRPHRAYGRSTGTPRDL